METNQGAIQTTTAEVGQVKAPATMTETLKTVTQETQATQPAKVDPPAADQSATEASQRLSAAAKRERKAFQMMKEAKQIRSQVDADAKAAREWRALRDSAKNNPLDYLKQAGLSPEDINNFILNDNKPTTELEVKALRDEQQKFKQEMAEKENKRLEDEARRSQQEVTATIETFKTRLNEFISSKPDDYELINMNQEQQLVYATIEEHYKLTGEEEFKKTGRRLGKILSNKEAADMVEQYLEEQIAEIAGKSKKIQNRLKPKEADDKSSTTNQRSATLSNEMTSSAPSLLSPKTEQDRIKRALAALGN